MKAFVCACLCGLLITASAQMKYSDAKFGVSFEYPRGYVLKKGPLDKNKDIGMGYLGPVPMEFVVPGGVRIATIEAPAGSYPGTDFVSAFFTVSVNPYLTNAKCKQFTDDLAVARQKELMKEISGVKFYGVQVGSAGLSHQFSGVYFYGFSEGSCYEIGYGVATAGYGAIDGIKQVDSRGIFSTLENVLSTVSLRMLRPSGAAKGHQSRSS
jgi:hypothetical protein